MSQLRARCVTQSWFRIRLRACGSRTLVIRPLFWTPECISLGRDVLLWPGCRIEGIEDGGAEPHIIVGDGVTMQQNCHITAAGELSIGSGTTVLFDVMITDIDHRYEQFGVRVIDQPIAHSPTRIGANCFIGSGARILAGTRLGDSTVVGANAVVRGEYPAGVVIAGNPGRIVRRYDPATRSWIKVEAT